MITTPERDLRLQVESRAVVADGVVLLTLRNPEGSDLPAWSPGAHIDLRLVDGVTRQYSLCGDVGDRARWRVGVLHDPNGRGGSEHVHQQLHPGTTVDVRGPRNHFPLDVAPRYLFLAGGVGITPIIPMVAAAAARGADWALHYGGRTRTSMAFGADLLTQYPSRVTLYPEDEVGLLDLEGLLGDPSPHTLVYCCGPEGLLTAVEQHCAGWSAGSVRVERFSPKHVGEPVRSNSFTVKLANSGRILTVTPQQSVLETLTDAGVDIQSSCQEGTCGTCETPVLSGVVDHRDSLLTDDERAAHDTMFVCVSRAVSAQLVLDL